MKKIYVNAPNRRNFWSAFLDSVHTGSSGQAVNLLYTINAFPYWYDYIISGFYGRILKPERKQSEKYG